MGDRPQPPDAEAVTLTVDDRIVRTLVGKTVLQVADKLGIEIPTLCYDPRIPPDASCSVCLVEVRDEDGWSLAHSCTTLAGEGMVVRTESPEIFRARRTAIELLLSDHYADCVAPCVLHCPAGVDIPAYVEQVRLGDYAKAVEIVRRTNPLPAVCGRVCPHPCEVVCLRGVVDDAVAINPLKRAVTELLASRVAAGADPEKADPNPRPGEPTGRRIAVVGAGPTGLSAAHFLRLAGHAVTVFDAGSAAGGMLRYGIPAYRLPRSVLDADIAVLERLGVDFVFETRLGRDTSVQGLLSRPGWGVTPRSRASWTPGTTRCCWRWVPGKGAACGSRARMRRGCTGGWTS
ncbi:MAG: (2Fe-2S)-binding protein [Deltaproteobacteria bacterium]|nr:(2Fe-2S)-binding protein [Deltaproteobacteria bacterium]